MSKKYRVKDNIWYKGRIITSGTQLELPMKEAKNYLDIEVIEEISIEEKNKEKGEESDK